MDKEKDRVAEIFAGKTVFITGGSGFLGKIFLDKLLRYTEVKKILLLVRNKKGKTPQERLDDIFGNVLFETLKNQRPNALKKCQVIAGDVSQDDLGISPEDRRIIVEETDYIVNSAASTRFDDSVKTAVKFNTRSVKMLLALAEECKHLKVFLHVSTAYAFPKEKVLYEKPYKPPADVQHVLDTVNFGKDEECEKLLGDCPNTYTFSKALAEQLVVEKFSKLPAVIVRPSVVCPILKDPVPGWCNNLQGPMGLFVGAGKGIIRSMYMNSESYADFVPADAVINGSLVAMWNFLKNGQGSVVRERIMNITSSSEFNYTWEELIETGKSVIYNDIPFNGVVWYPGGSIKKSRIIHNICFYLFQLLPAILIDALLVVLGYKPLLYQIQRRIQKGGEVFEYYTTKAWNFSHLGLTEMREKLNDRERDTYKIDGEGFDLKDYLRKCMMTVRRNNLKETDDQIPAAKRHMRVMWVVDKTCKSLFLLALVYYTYKWFLAPVLKI